MAIPPEPLSELLQAADRVVVAEVIAVLHTGAKPARPGGAMRMGPGATDTGWMGAAQRVRLRVTRELKGGGPVEIVVEKPEAPYMLNPGNSGPFFLEGERIIGRYGPDTHRLEAIERALGGTPAP